MPIKREDLDAAGSILPMLMTPPLIVSEERIGGHFRQGCGGDPRGRTRVRPAIRENCNFAMWLSSGSIPLLSPSRMVFGRMNLTGCAQS
jgi:hypothetical protein